MSCRYCDQGDASVAMSCGACGKEIHFHAAQLGDIPPDVFEVRSFCPLCGAELIVCNSVMAAALERAK